MPRTFFFSFEHNHRPATAEYSVSGEHEPDTNAGACATVEKAWYDDDSAVGAPYIDLSEVDLEALEARIIEHHEMDHDEPTEGELRA
jgi:Mg2+ and Co2+ transporter CorA